MRRNSSTLVWKPPKLFSFDHHLWKTFVAEREKVCKFVANQCKRWGIAAGYGTGGTGPGTPKGPHLIQSTLRSSQHCRRPLPSSSPRTQTLPSNLSYDIIISLSLNRPSFAHTRHTLETQCCPHTTLTLGRGCIWSDRRQVACILCDCLWSLLAVSAILTRLTPGQPGARPPPGPAWPRRAAGQGPRVFTFILNVFKTETILR